MMSTSQSFNRGDVVLVTFPNSNLQTGKVRPALIVQTDNLATGLNQVIVAMITSQLSRAGHLSRVKIPRNTPEGKRAGLLVDSVVMTDNLATVRYDRILRVLGHIPMNEVDVALRHTLAL